MSVPERFASASLATCPQCGQPLACRVPQPIERLRGVLEAMDDLHAMLEDERKRHEHAWAMRAEAYQAIERCVGRVEGWIRRMVEQPGSGAAAE